MKLAYRYLGYGYGFRNGKKVFYITKGWKILEVFIFFNVIRLDEDEATRIFDLWAEQDLNRRETFE